ncbi:RNA-binding motif protein, X-linked 2 [Halotydeus destructor]|nr:RNA-binding motif protein, X-linked 2 [Halotydeus destructor]
MNPLTNVRNITKLNERELQLGIEQKNSWHNMYKDSAWIFIGGMNFELTEGDIICVFSQFGEVVNINLVRDKKTGKSKGFAFLCYEDQRSTVLAVDNLNGIKLVGRIIRVDHVEKYKIPKEDEEADEIVKKLQEDGCAPLKIEVRISPDKDVLETKHHRHRDDKIEKRQRDKSRRERRSSSASSEERSSKKHKKHKKHKSHKKHSKSRM